jgi:hypothetical protein
MPAKFCVSWFFKNSADSFLLNARTVARFFGLPPDRVVKLGVQIRI